MTDESDLQQNENAKKFEFEVDAFALASFIGWTNHVLGADPFRY